MNFLHLKYIVEVSKAKSINKAAENLYMAQPNLSRAIKELEDSLGITIFNRTSKGMELTAQGVDFVKQAQKILKDVDELEGSFINKKKNLQEFSISIPRASYISTAFNKFLLRVDKSKNIEFNYKETNSMGVIKDVTENGFKLGILRCSSQLSDYFDGLLEEKDLDGKEIFEFKYVLLMSKESKLNELAEINMADLKEYIELLHGDPYVPSISGKEAKKAGFSGITDKNIFIYERGSQYEILDSVKETYMWVSPLCQELLDKYNLVQRECKDSEKLYKDILIYNKDYSFSDLDEIFLEELISSKNQVKNI